MRIDKFLQVSRIIKRRSIAKEVCLSGRVQINSRVAKPGSEVETGDRIALTWGTKTREYEILIVPERSVPAAQAKTLYRCLTGNHVSSSTGTDSDSDLENY